MIWRITTGPNRTVELTPEGTDQVSVIYMAGTMPEENLISEILFMIPKDFKIVLFNFQIWQNQWD